MKSLYESFHDLYSLLSPKFLAVLVTINYLEELEYALLLRYQRREEGGRFFVKNSVMYSHFCRILIVEFKNEYLE
jgi:hypothetical protein